MDLTHLIGEATEYDKKQAVEMKKPKSWLKSVSAFANTVGGALIFGITDDDEVVGIDDIKVVSEYGFTNLLDGRWKKLIDRIRSCGSRNTILLFCRRCYRSIYPYRQ